MTHLERVLLGLFYSVGVLLESFSVAPVGARNSVVAGQAAFLYSLLSPSHGVEQMFRGGAGSRPALSCGLRTHVVPWSREQCGRWVLWWSM